MDTSNDSKPEKITKREKEERKKLKKASAHMEKELEEKTHTKISAFIIVLIDALILIGILFLTKNLFSIILVYGYMTLSTLIALVPYTVTEYERIGKTPPFLIRISNSLLKKVLPMDRKKIKLGPSMLLSFVFVVTVGGFIAIVVITFADFLTANPAVYEYLLDGAPSGQYGFFSFVTNSLANSMVPAILWYIIIFTPAIFCFLFLTASVYYRTINISKILRIVTFSPLVVLLPLFLTAQSITSPSIVIACIFIIAWIITILIWYRQSTKRNALILFSILFTQVLSSYLIIYGFIFHAVAPTPQDVSAYYNPLFLLLWFGVLIAIPIVVKVFDTILKGKFSIIGPLLAVAVAIIFQFNFFNLFNESISTAYYGSPNTAELYVGFGFFYFYIAMLIIPLFFIFGYFQIGLVRWLYRAFRNYGEKINRRTLLKVLGGFLALLFIFGLVIVYYFILYTPEDYQNMLSQLASLFNGGLVDRLTNMTSITGAVYWTDVIDVSTLAITMGFLAYSSYRGAYNLCLYADQIEDPQHNIKRLGLFNFIIFTSPRSYKTRLIFGISLIFVFLGISAIFAFLKIHSVLFWEEFNVIENPIFIIFGAIDGIKLAISIVGMIAAIIIFLYFLARKTKVT